MRKTLTGLVLGLSVFAAHADLLDRGDGVLFDSFTQVTWDLNFTPTPADRELAYALYPIHMNGTGPGIAPYPMETPYRGVTTWRVPNLAEFQSFASQVTDQQTAALPKDLLYWTGNTTTGPYPIPYVVLFDLAAKEAVYGTAAYLAHAYFTPVASGDVISPVPEPGTYAMFLAGLAGVALITRRKRQ